MHSLCNKFMHFVITTYAMHCTLSCNRYHHQYLFQFLHIIFIGIGVGIGIGQCIHTIRPAYIVSKRTWMRQSEQMCVGFASILVNLPRKGPFTSSASDASAISLQIKCNAVVQLCNDAPGWVCNPFSSVSIDFNESRISNVIAELSQRWCWRLV